LGTVSVNFAIPSVQGSSSTRATQTVPSQSLAIVLSAYQSGSTPPVASLQCLSNAAPAGFACIGDLAVAGITATPSTTSVCSAAASGGRACTISFAAPVGQAVIVSAVLYDQQPVCSGSPASCSITGANAIGSATSAPTAITANGSFPVTLTFNASPPVALSGSAATVPITPTASGSIGAGSTINFGLPGGSYPAGATASVTEVLSLTIPLSAARRPASAPSYQPSTPGAPNTFVYGFGFALSGLTALPSQLAVNATFNITGSLAAAFSKVSSSGTLFVAQMANGTYTGVGTLNYVYSGNATSGVLTIADAANSGITGPGIYIIYLPPPSAATPPPSTTSLYVANQGESSVGLVYSIAGGNPLLTLTGISEPERIVVDPLGTVYIADYGANAIDVFSAGSTSPTRTITTGISSPAGLVMDASGTLYVGNYGNSTVTEYPFGATSPSVTLTGAVTPCAVAVDQKATVYASNCDSPGTSVSIFPAGSTTSSTSITNGVSHPFGLAVDSSGALYVANDASNSVTVYPAAQLSLASPAPSTTLSNGVSGPYGLTVDTSGNVYVGNCGAGNIVKFAAGSMTSTVFATGLGCPIGLAAFPGPIVK